MALFTGMAILEEQFGTAYFRFNDDTYAELQPWLRPSDDAQEFVSQWDETARNLADFDALRLLMSIDHFLPPRGSGETKLPETQSGTDRMLHARLQGRKLGTFDVYFDSEVPEPLWAGHMRTVAMKLIDDRHLASAWSFYENGKLKNTETAQYTRVK